MLEGDDTASRRPTEGRSAAPAKRTTRGRHFPQVVLKEDRYSYRTAAKQAPKANDAGAAVQ